MPLATFSEAAKLMGYKSRSQLYKMKRDGWLNDYIVEIAGKNYLDLQPRGKASLDNHIMGIIQWRPSNPIRELETECLQIEQLRTSQTLSLRMTHIGTLRKDPFCS